MLKKLSMSIVNVFATILLVVLSMVSKAFLITALTVLVVYIMIKVKTKN